MRLQTRVCSIDICVLRDRALATALACVRGAAQGRSVELLRKESLAGLAPAAAARVLSHAYLAVVPITPLPFPPLPLSPLRPGASEAALSPGQGLCPGRRPGCMNTNTTAGGTAWPEPGGKQKTTP